MALYVYITDNCLSDARQHALLDEVERFRDRVIKSQSTNLLDPFPPPYLVKKKLGGRQGRLLCELRSIGDYAVVVFLAVLIRGNREYEDFSRDPVAFGKQNLAHLVSEDDITQFLETERKKDPIPEKPVAKDIEYTMLYGAFDHRQHPAADDLICETKEWVDHVSQERISKQLALLNPACLAALSKSHGLHFLPVASKPGWGIWALRGKGRLLLIIPATDATREESEQTARSIAGRLDPDDAASVLRASRRAYPAIVLADDELWIDLEHETVANMALSPEESSVLESARRSHQRFPLFINGRAGSGKSTILQYLFADLLFSYLKTPEAPSMAPPVYITANGELLRVARRFVERVLQSEAEFVQESVGHLIEENRTIFEGAFAEFRPYVLSLVPAEARAKLFPVGSKVDYARFHQLWEERFGRDRAAHRDYGPDLSWHVIRSYIKGMSSETYLDPDDYTEIPEKQHTVTHEAYKLVFERVWVGWYQEIFESGKVWDDQDLTRYVLENDLAKPMYPAVFCDEAQDFTRLELELLLRINLFSNRSLSSDAVARVPFAFAGDQFQTLNPTGFRWDAIKASFMEKFVFALDPAKRSGRTDLNYWELKYNYRSTDKIVRFSNYVQALRAALFQIPDLRPQVPWSEEKRSPAVIWFRENDSAFWNKFREDTGFVVIIPCNEGEETDYVKQDPILREHIKIEDDVPQNVLSAARAKGCEYPAVLVYGFGAAAPYNIAASLLEAADHEPNPDGSLLVQYFINRLYVAVSRAKRRVVIVDSERGIEYLWKSVMDERTKASMLSRIKNGDEVWGDAIDGMTLGTPDDLVREGRADPAENARVFEADGLARNDPFLLRQAAQAYRTARDAAKARECLARALEAEGAYYEAGSAYFEAGFPVPDGVRCLWRSGERGWEALKDEITRHPEIRNETEVQWASGLTEGRPTIERVISLLESLNTRLSHDRKFAENSIGDNAWQKALSPTMRSLISNGGTPLDSNVAMQLSNMLEHIQEKGISFPHDISAMVCFAAHKYADAITFWEQSGDTRSISFCQAKARTEAYPESIAWLARLGAQSDIIKAYLDRPETSLSPEQAVMVCDALRTSGRIKEALILGWAFGLSDTILDLALDAYRLQMLDLASEATRYAVQLLALHGRWDPLASLLSSSGFLPARSWKDKAVRDWVDAELEHLQASLVRALARSDSLVKAAPNHQKKVSIFLGGYLRVKARGWMATISIQEAGAAFERAGRFTDAISFYDAALREKGIVSKPDTIRKRWLICKKKQLDYEQSVGAYGSTDKCRRIESDLRRAQQEWGLDIPAGPEYPQLQPLAGPSSDMAWARDSDGAHVDVGQGGGTDVGALRDRATMNLDMFRVDIARANGRCNITNTVTMETAFIKWSERQCGGEVEFSQDDYGCWKCGSWDLSVRFPRNRGGDFVMRWEGLGIEVAVVMEPRAAPVGNREDA